MIELHSLFLGGWDEFLQYGDFHDDESYDSYDCVQFESPYDFRCCDDSFNLCDFCKVFWVSVLFKVPEYFGFEHLSAGQRPCVDNSDGEGVVFVEFCLSFYDSVAVSDFEPAPAFEFLLVVGMVGSDVEPLIKGVVFDECLVAKEGS